MVQVKNVITGSTATLGGIAGVMYCFITSKKAGGPTLGATVVYGVIGVAVGALVGYISTGIIKPEDEKFT